MLGPAIMANADEISASVTNTVPPEPSKTYMIDWDTGEIYSQWVDGIDAVKQMAVKMIRTLRDQYIIYSSDIGSEIGYLYGQQYSLDYLNMEIPRLITEALSVDDRFKSADNFTVTRSGDELDISFTLTTNLGDSTTVEVTV